MKGLLITAICFVFLGGIECKANVVLPDVISDSMVLQRDRPVSIWGQADAGEVVTVRFSGQSRTVKAEADGHWRIQLGVFHANPNPITMTIAGKNTIDLKNILVGEVWVVAGQSNMQRLLSETTDGDAAIAAANNPLIRLFNVSRQVAFKHQEGPLATWQTCSPESVKTFSAAGYYFGVELQRQ